LQSGLTAVGLPVVGAEADGTPRFGTDTQARVRDFQKRYGLQETGDVDPATGGVMSLSALVARHEDLLETKSPELPSELGSLLSAR
jgi:hypothetical protein